MDLNDEDVWLFRHNGFLLAPRRLPVELVDEINHETDLQLEQAFEPVVWKKDPADPERRFINRLSDILHRASVYVDAATHAAVLDPLECLIGPNVELVMNWHNHLMVRPKHSPRVYWHRGSRLHAPVLVTAIIALANTTVENGCLRIVPGTHLDPFNGDFYLAEEASREEAKKIPFREHVLYRRAVPIPMESGAILFFNDAVYHGSDVNETEDQRRTLTLAYMAHEDHLALKGDTSRVLVRGRREYRGLSATPEADLKRKLASAVPAPVR